jgi:hypothetical protein
MYDSTFLDRCHRSLTLVLFASITILVALAPSARASLFTDGDFVSINWTGQQFVTGTSTASATTSATGGQPAAYRSVVNVSSGGPLSGWDRSLYVELNNTAIYDPNASGAITQLDYSEDHFCTCLGGGMLWGPAIEQGGTYYIVTGNVIPNGTASFAWANAQLIGLTASDFEEVQVTGSSWSLATSQPDFSSSGAPITFGYVRAKAFVASTSSGLDNWTVSVNESPVATDHANWSTIKGAYK